MLPRVIDSIEVHHRVDFSLLCNSRGVRYAIEIGTDQGEFSNSFMERFDGLGLFCVDPYTQYEYLPEDRTPDLMMAVVRLSKWGSRVRMLRTTSELAAKNLPWWVRDKVDFVYVDGCHDYESVKSDLNTWWPLLSEGGILAGHDFEHTHLSVVNVVMQFAADQDRVVRIVSGDSPESWYIYKREPVQLHRHYFIETKVSNDQMLSDRRDEHG